MFNNKVYVIKYDIVYKYTKLLSIKYKFTFSEVCTSVCKLTLAVLGKVVVAAIDPDICH